MPPALRPCLALVLVALSTAACGSSSAGSPTGASSGSGGGGTSDQEPANMAGMTAAHNAARAAVKPAANPPLAPLTWDGSLAEYAQTYSEKCTWQHSMGPYGENIFASFGENPKPADVVTAWVSEDAIYDYASNTCTPNSTLTECGHYTQVVWRDTMRLGCGMTNCTTGSPFGMEPWQFWVCDYDPPGNVNGARPY